MPTAAKLVAALFLASTAAITTYVYDDITPTFRAQSAFYAANAIFGLIIGWRVLGRDPGLGGPKSIFTGLRATITLVVCTIVAYAIWYVIDRLRYFYIKEIWGVLDSFVDAVINYSEIFLNPTLIITLAICGAISGIAAGLANRFWS